MSESYRHYYYTLTQSQQKLYAAIYKKLNACGSPIKLPLVHPNEVLIAFNSVLLDYPQFFYVESYNFTKELNKNELIVEPEYIFNAAELRANREAISQSLAFVSVLLSKGCYDKTWAVHDYFLDNVSYDYAISQSSKSILGIAKNRSGICESIAKYVKMALDRLSVKCIVIIGTAVNPTSGQIANEPHAWNMVELNGEWYHLDVTYDITLSQSGKRYDYFLVRDSDIMQFRSVNGIIPKSSQKPSDYYSINKLAVAKSVELERLISDRLQGGHYSMQFKLLNVRAGLNPSDNVLTIAQEQCQRLLNRNCSINVNYNQELWVFDLIIN